LALETMEALFRSSGPLTIRQRAARTSTVGTGEYY
jgi:hypothetical protein